MAREAAGREPVVGRLPLAWGVLLPALALGILADLVVRADPPGFGVLVWTTSLIGAGAGLAWWRRETFRGIAGWLPIVALLAAGGLAWRDSPTLKLLDLLSLALVLALTAVRTPGLVLPVTRLTDLVLAAATTGMNALLQPVALASNLARTSDVDRRRSFRHVRAALIGVCLALPLVLVFGMLFSAADAVFAGYVADLFRLNLGAWALHLEMILGATWLIAGFLWGAAVDERLLPAHVELPRPPRLGIVEAGVALALLDLLFLAFVIVQIRYLFGGADLVLRTDLSYADYARRGFFELVTVSALALPLLLLTDWLLRRVRPAEEWVFRALAALLLILLLVVIASALQRMRLYQREYGLTELRLYTTAFMLWLGAVFLWLAGTVLRGKPERFAFGALVAGLLAIAALHLLNPDALIARTNVARAGAGKPVDTGYLSRLSADAAPVIVNALPELSEPGRCELARTLRLRWSTAADDWRSWSLSRARAERSAAGVPPC